MAYQTYITEALVCGSWDRNTADKSILLFAREAGMVYVQAKSVRKEESKQRYALQNASRIRATLVRGKTGWKVAGAEPLQSLYATAETREARALLRDTILLLRRLMHGEVPHQDIFDDVISVLSRSAEFPGKPLQTLLFLRILHTLGYVAPEASYANILTDTFPFEEVAKVSDGDIVAFEAVIKNALDQSQM